MSAYLQRLRLRSEGWHGRAYELGNGFIEDGETPTTAMSICGMLDVKVERYPLGLLDPDTKEILYQTGSYRMVVKGLDETYVIPRNVKRYEPLQNDDLAKLTDPISEYAQLEGVLQLGQYGEISVVQFRLEPFEVGGNPNEIHETYLMFGDDKNGGGLSVDNVKTRVVCANTFKLAVREVTPIPHSKDTELYVRFAVQNFLAAQKQAEYERQMLNRMFTTPINDINNKLDKLFGVNKGKNLRNLERIGKFKAEDLFDKNLQVSDDEEIQKLVEKEIGRYQNQLERQNILKEAVADNYVRFNDSHSYAAETAYAFFNAVTELNTHGGYKKDGRPIFYGDDVSNHISNLFGDRAKVTQDAWNLCVNVK